VLGNWQIGTIVVAESGAPLSVYSNAPQLIGYSAPSIAPAGTGYADNNRPIQIGDCKVSGGDPEQIINPAAFTLTGYILGTTNQQAGRGSCYGPGYFSTDLAFYKTVKLSGKVSAQLRFDIFNVFNTANFSTVGFDQSFNPIITLDSPTLATATKVTGTTLQNGSTFGRATVARDPRQAQFAIKLMF